ncbi:MAG TPA: hypothetical protein VLG44_05740 [Chlamydiales bacterium]|nr:hypothetical protein [Chlamydiales bacterium]
MRTILIVLSFLFASISHAEIASIEQQIEHDILQGQWELQADEAAKVMSVFRSAQSHPDYEELLKDFVQKAESIKLVCNEQGPKSSMDARQVAPEFHPLVAENCNVRILLAKEKVGDIVPRHSHEWPSIMVTLCPSDFLLFNDDGSESVWQGKLGVDVNSGDFDPISVPCKCIGPQDYFALLFEFKD